MLQAVNKETQSLLLTFNRFHILSFLLLTLSICLLDKVIHAFPSKQIHAQSQQGKP